MGIQTGLEEYECGYLDESLDVGKAVRNINYHMLDGSEINRCQRLVLEEILKNPDGTNDKGIAVNTGLPLSSVCARRNELVKMGLVSAIGIGFYPDYKSRLRPNKIWGVNVK